MAGEPVQLTPHEFDLLRVLAGNEGKLLTHQAILREVWGPAYQASRTTSMSTSRSYAARSSRTHPAALSAHGARGRLSPRGAIRLRGSRCLETFLRPEGRI